MAYDPNTVDIPPTQQFRLPNPANINNRLIRRVCVMKVEGSAITVRPLKLGGKVQPTQCVHVSLFLINRIGKRGTVIHFDRQGISNRFTPAPEMLVEMLVKRYE